MYTSLITVDAETRWLRRWGWLFPVFGLPLGALIVAGRWVLIALDTAYWPDTVRGWITPTGLAIGFTIALIPLFWRLSLYIERRVGAALRSACVAPIGALAVFLCAEAAARSFVGQEMLWQSIRARAGENYFAREVALLRLDHAALMREGKWDPGVVVAGSSQMLHALDAPHLASDLGRPVYRRAVAGMFPVELCAATGFLDFDARNELLLMLSGFDLGGRDRLYPDAIRPISTAEGAWLLTRAAGLSFLLKHWRVFVDVLAAGTCELWRSRDFMRLAMQHPFAPVRLAHASSTGNETTAQREAYLSLGRDAELVAYTERVLTVFFERMAEKFRGVVVVEGRLNPAYPGSDAAIMHQRAREIAEAAAARGLTRFIPIEAQPDGPQSDDWLDMAHVNARGRAAYTRLFARILTAEPTDSLP